MATVSVNTITESIVTVTTANADVANGDVFTNHGGDLCLLLKNPGSDAATVTIAAQETSKEVPGYGPMTKSDIVVSLSAGQEKVVGPLRRPFNNASGNEAVAYSGDGASDVDVFAFRVPAL